MPEVVNGKNAGSPVGCAQPPLIIPYPPTQPPLPPPPPPPPPVPPLTVNAISDFAKAPVKSYQSHSYLTGVVSAKAAVATKATVTCQIWMWYSIDYLWFHDSEKLENQIETKWLRNTNNRKWIFHGNGNRVKPPCVWSYFIDSATLDYIYSHIWSKLLASNIPSYKIKTP